MTITIKIKIKIKNIKVKGKCVLCTIVGERREKNYEYVILVGYIK